MINFEKLGSTPVTTEPFPHFVVEGLLSDDDLDAVSRDFPPISSSGVYPLSELKYGPAFERLVDEIKSPRLRDLLGERLGVPLGDRPQMITVRGNCATRDGRIHTDSKDKIVTCLLYLNDRSWNATSGRLRLLRNGHDIEDKIAEVPPNGGTLIVFKRTDNSWHGHLPYEGPRRYVMFNWVTSDATLAKNLGRHHLAAWAKRLLPV